MVVRLICDILLRETLSLMIVFELREFKTFFFHKL